MATLRKDEKERVAGGAVNSAIASRSSQIMDHRTKYISIYEMIVLIAVIVAALTGCEPVEARLVLRRPARALAEDSAQYPTDKVSFNTSGEARVCLWDRSLVSAVTNTQQNAMTPPGASGGAESTMAATMTPTKMTGAPSCSLNPAYLFSLVPQLDGDRCVCCPRTGDGTLPGMGMRLQCCRHLLCRLLLEITAMRYGCLRHTEFESCIADQGNWCTWQENTNRCVRVRMPQHLGGWHVGHGAREN